MQPLPEELQVQKIPQAPFNLGLWYDKLFDRWKPGFFGIPDSSRDGNREEPLAAVDKLAWVEKAARIPVLNDSAKRFVAMIDKIGGVVKILETDGRFVTGLGRSHPIENGFTWHHSRGQPYLPGSSFKGMMRAWFRELGESERSLNRVFGPAGPNDAAAGSVVFFDAIPYSSVQLEAEGMTSHHTEYYQADQAKEPADWDEPVPIAFLMVAKRQEFLFAVAPRRRGCENDRNDCNRVAEEVEAALRELGAGAKTAVGYGRFRPGAEKKLEDIRKENADEAAKLLEEQRFNQRLKGASEIYREFEIDLRRTGAGSKPEKLKADGWLEGWLDRIQAEPDPAVIRRLRELIEGAFDPGLLVDPHRKRGKQGKAFKPRQVKIAETFLRLEANLKADK